MDRIEMEICFASNGAITATISALLSSGNARKKLKRADANFNHIYKEECVGFLIRITTWKR